MMTEANTDPPNAGDLVFQRRERLIVGGASREVFVLGFRHGSAGARAVAQGGVVNRGVDHDRSGEFAGLAAGGLGSVLATSARRNHAITEYTLL
jgi:hypothetical protein